MCPTFCRTTSRIGDPPLFGVLQMSCGCNAYNQPVVHIFFLSRLRRIGQLAATLALGLAFAFSTTANARGQAAAESASDRSSSDRGRILLVLPFDNRTGQPSLEWIREAAPEILSSRFASAGFAPMSRAGPPLCAGPPGAAAGFSSLAGQFDQAGRDAGR